MAETPNREFPEEIGLSATTISNFTPFSRATTLRKWFLPSKTPGKQALLPTGNGQLNGQSPDETPGKNGIVLTARLSLADLLFNAAGAPVAAEVAQ